MSQKIQSPFAHAVPQSRVLRICHLTTVHPRNDIRILLKECKSLMHVGYKVYLVVGDGKGDAVMEGIKVYDIGANDTNEYIKTLIAQGVSVNDIAANPQSRIRRMLTQPKKALEKVLSLQPDIVHFHDPELLPIGVKLTRKGIRVIYDAHEDVPRQTLSKQWIPQHIRPLIASIVELYENYAARKISGVVAATPTIERRFFKQGLRTVNVNNYPLLEEFTFNEGKADRHKNICYIGAISRMRGVLQIVQALPLVPDVRLILCGEIDDPEFGVELRSEPGWTQVEYLGYVDRKTLRSLMAKSFAGLVTLLPSVNYLNSLPVKMFEYMSASLPVIASNFPLFQEIIGGADCGICVDPESHKAIAGAIQRLLDSPAEVERMGHAGRQAILNKYNWGMEAQKLIKFYATLP